MNPSPDDLSLSSWLARLNQARAPEEIVNVVRRYMFCVPPEDLEKLPRECHDVSIQDATSLSQWAVTFRRAELTTGSNVIDGGLLQRMSAVLTTASSRLAAVSMGRARSTSS